MVAGDKLARIPEAQTRKTNLELGWHEQKEPDCAGSSGPGVGRLFL